MLTQWSLEADRKTFVYGYTDLLKIDLRPYLHKIEATTLILAAALPFKEQVVTTMESQYQALKNKEIIVVDDSRHFIMFDRPDWFHKQVNSFIDL